MPTAQSGIRVKTHPNQDTIWLDLETGRLQAALTDTTVPHDWLTQKGKAKGFELAGKPLDDVEMFGEGTGIAVRKGDPLRARFNTALKKVLTDGTFAAENKKVFRGSLLAVAPGQLEAARALGLSGVQTFFSIRLPQAWRIALPSLGNLWHSLLKDTSLVSVVGLEDLLKKRHHGSASHPPAIFVLHHSGGGVFCIAVDVRTGVQPLGVARATALCQRLGAVMQDVGWGYAQLLHNSGAELLQGLVIALQLWLASCVLGFVLALLLALCNTVGNRYMQGLARAHIACIRGTPLLVQMFIWYYGLGQFEVLRESILWVVLEDAWCCGLLALTLNIAAYMAEDIRAGIQAVPAPHLEAAQAFGMAPWLIVRRILLPEVLQIVTPALGNEWVSQLKVTALVSTITVLDMAGVARRLSIESYTTDALVVAGMIYAVLTLLISAGIRMLERKQQRYTSGQRR